MVFAEVDQGPAEHPAAHGQQAEPSRDQERVAKQRSTAALRHLHEAEDRKRFARAVREAAPSPRGLSSHNYVRVLASETIVQTSLLANMTVMKIARW